MDGQFDSDANKGETEDDSTLIPLEENVLTVNFGVPVVIVMTKVFFFFRVLFCLKSKNFQKHFKYESRSLVHE